MAAPQSLTLRQAIIERVKDLPVDELRSVVEDSIGNDERSLPGLGVLFEIIWRHLDAPIQDQVVSALHSGLPHMKQ